MPQFDPASFQSQIIWLIICLSLIFFFLKKYLIPRFSKIDSERQSLIDSEEDKIQKIELRIQHLREERALRLKEVKAEAAALLEAARLESEKSQEEQIRSIDQELSARLVEFKEQLAWYIKSYERDFEQNLKSVVDVAKSRLHSKSN